MMVFLKMAWFMFICFLPGWAFIIAYVITAIKNKLGIGE